MLTLVTGFAFEAGSITNLTQSVVTISATPERAAVAIKARYTPTLTKASDQVAHFVPFTTAILVAVKAVCALIANSFYGTDRELFILKKSRVIMASKNIL